MNDTLVMNKPSISDPSSFEQHLETVQADWLTSIKARAWEEFNSLTMPSRKDEKWRFATLDKIRQFDQFSIAEPSSAQEIESVVKKSRRLETVAGRLVFANDNLVDSLVISDELKAKGVIFCSLAEAIEKHSDLVKEYLTAQSPELGSAKFEALHLAMVKNGTFLYVPDNLEIAEPFVTYTWSTGSNNVIFPHTIFVTGKNTKASLIEFQESLSDSHKNFVIANSDVFAGEGAKPSHTIVQNWNLETTSLQLNTNNAQRDTDARSIIVNIGSAQARQEIHGKIFGSGSNVEIYSLSVPQKDQEIDQRTLQTHLAPHSRSDLLFRNALLDQSRSIFSGLIIVGEGAQQTDAYQTNNNLMLSDSAESNSLPGLEIKANDVKCSHGSTSGRIDESELFYFLARGIPRKAAQELMVFGYFEEILKRLDNQAVYEYVREKLKAKFSH